MSLFGQQKGHKKLGYRTNATIYEKDEFNKRKHQIKESINPTVMDKLFSSYLKSDDLALVALAQHEAQNMQMRLSTIIFLQVRPRNGFNISGYIDYADSLCACSLRMLGATNWRAIFEGRIMLRPNRTDLSFHDWHSGFFTFNHSENYRVINYSSCLMFKHTGDKIVPVTTTDSIYI